MLLPLVNLALALQDTTPTDAKPSSGGFSWVPLVLIGAVFYFVLIAPERKNRRAREAMLGELKKGDRVMTTGGMHASVAQVQDDVVTLQIADGVRVRFARAAIQSVIPQEGSDDKATGS